MAEQVLRWRADDGTLCESEAEARLHDDRHLLALWLEGHPHLNWLKASSPTAVASVLLTDSKCPFRLERKPGALEQAVQEQKPA